ncbi:molybdopterin converting factor [Acidihalobacter ferrooxydans]|uniref:Molybdopterin synthase catalytic subunit n=1 Tax=Acidihalobacter ferrooxydans TaxID=1765967 RepID=A0A1P8ULS6_9GAMM|nr:molybdopterin converting factor [Acidihalobacter ferrooxydans]
MVRLETAIFDPWSTLRDFEQTHDMGDGRSGAAAVFVGTMRDFNAGDGVRRLFLEHYPGMTERELERIADEAVERWPVNACLIVHRVGLIVPGEPIVLTAAWSAHRNAGFDACRHLIEALKHRAPFWKREDLANGEQRWVSENTPA